MQPDRSRSRFPLAIVLAVAAAVAILSGWAVWRLSRPTSEELLTRALAAEPGEAEPLLRQAVSRDPANHNARLALAWTLAQRDDWKQAEAQFAEVDISACSSDLLVKFGQQAMRSGRHEQSVRALAPVAERSGRESLVALAGLVAAYGKLGRQEAMIGAAQALAEKQPDNAQNWWQLIQLLKAARQETECLAAVQQALRNDPPREMEIEFRYYLVEQLIIQGDTAGAWKEIDALESLEGQNLRLETKKIDLYRLEGKLDKALAAIEAIFPAVGHMTVAKLTRGAVYLDLGRYEEARQDLEQVVAAEPFNEGAHFKLSQAYRLLGDEPQARRHVEANLEIRRKRIRINELLKKQETEPLDEKACRELASLYQQLGDPASSELWRRRSEQARRSVAGVKETPN